MQKIIITGADGFIGQKLTEFLAGKGSKISAFVYKYCDLVKLKTYKSVEYVPMELENIKQIESTLSVGYDLWYHLAWSGVHADTRNDYELQIKNVQYCVDVMELAKRVQVKKVIFPGSAGEFAGCGEPITGYNTPCPNDAYSATKTAVRIICQSYAQKYDIPFIYTVISSIYGPGRDDNNILSYAIKNLLAGNSPAFTKLEQKWNYIYIDDLVEALYLIGLKGIPGSVYPIGGTDSLPLSEYIKKIHVLIDSAIPLKIGELPYKNNKIDHSVMDISLTKKDTDFAPRITFDAGIKRVIEYFRSI